KNYSFLLDYPDMRGEWKVTTEINSLPHEELHIKQQFLRNFSGELLAMDNQEEIFRQYDFDGSFVTENIFRYHFKPRIRSNEVHFQDDGIGLIKLDSLGKGSGITVFFGAYTAGDIKSMKVSIEKKEK
ncbi:MAG: hypothetical protein KIT59_09855, partial [Nitrosomonas sp.]|nr:hypothetical protein [Nitrosomonas sp.]